MIVCAKRWLIGGLMLTFILASCKAPAISTTVSPTGASSVSTETPTSVVPTAWTTTSPMPTESLAPTPFPTKTRRPRNSVHLYPPTAPIRVAIIGPASGPKSDVSWAVQAGVERAVTDYGSVKGYSIELSFLDSGCEAIQGGQVAEEFGWGTAWATAVIGPICSASAKRVLPWLERGRIVAISPSVTRAEVSGYGPYIFNSVIPREGQDEGPMLQEINERPAVQELYSRLDRELAPDVRHYAAYAYDATMILLQAMEVVSEGGGENDLRVNPILFMDHVRGTDGFQGVTGEISFDGHGNRRSW